MRKLVSVITILTLSIFLAACGGGSSSSGASSYAGIYTGTSTMTLRGLSTTVTEVAPLRVVVGVDGQVSVSSPGSTGASCSGPQIPMSLVGNKASSSVKNVSCSTKDLKCTVSGTFTYSFASNSASQTGSAVMSCNVGRIDVTYSGYMKKTA